MVNTIYAMKQIKNKRDPFPCSESRCFPAAPWQRQGTLWRCCDAEITHQRWSFFSSSPPLYHEFNSCGQSFCNPGVVMLYVVVEYGLKLLASAQNTKTLMRNWRAGVSHLSPGWPSIVALTECTLPGFQMTFSTKFKGNIWCEGKIESMCLVLC